MDRESPLRRATDGGLTFEIAPPQSTAADTQRMRNPGTGFFDEVGKGVSRFNRGLSDRSLAKQMETAELAGDLAEVERVSALRGRSSNADAANAPAVSAFSDIRGAGDAASWLGSTLGEGVPSLGPAIAGGLAGRVGLGRVIGKTPGAMAGAAGVSYDQIRGGELAQQYDDEVLRATPIEERSRVARETALLGAGLEAFLPGRVAAGLARGRLSGAVLREGAPEFIAEGGQELISQRGQQQLDPTREYDLKDAFNASMAGLAVGTTVGARGRVVGDVKDKAVDEAERMRDGVKETIDKFRGPQPPDIDTDIDPLPPDAPLPRGPAGGIPLNADGESFLDGLSKRYEEVLQSAKNTASDATARVREVFRGSQQEQAEADLRPETEDPSVLNAADPAAAMAEREAGLAARAQTYAEDLLKDPNTPQQVRDRVAAFAPEAFSDPTVQKFVAASLSAVRRGEDVVTALRDAFSAIDGEAAPAPKDAPGTVRKNNLQELDPVRMAPLVSELAAGLGARAEDAPQLAKQLVALAARLSPDAKLTPELERRLRALDRAVDDNIVGIASELAGSDALQKSIARIRAIPSAFDDLGKSRGASYLESMLTVQLDDAAKRAVAKAVDEAGMNIGALNATRKGQVLRALGDAFGSVKRAQTVLEYYGGLRRAAIEKDAAANPGRDDRPASKLGDEVDVAESVETAEDPTYEGAADTAEWGALTEKDAGREFGFRFAGTQLPFRKFAGEKLSDGRTRREAMRAVENSKAEDAGSNMRAVGYAEYLAGQEVDADQGVARMRASIQKRITENDKRGRKPQADQLRGELQLLDATVKEKGAKQALNDLYEVVERTPRDQNPLEASDKDLQKMKQGAKLPNTSGMSAAQKAQVLKDHAKTVLRFKDADGNELVLGAKSMAETWGSKRKGSGNEASRQTDSDTLKEAVAAVIARGYTLQSPLSQVRFAADTGAAIRAPDADRAAALSAWVKDNFDVSATELLSSTREAADKLVSRLQAAVDAAGEASGPAYRAQLTAKTKSALDRIRALVDSASEDKTSADRAKDAALKSWRDGEMPNKGKKWAAYVEARAKADWSAQFYGERIKLREKADNIMREATQASDRLEKSGVTEVSESLERDAERARIVAAQKAMHKKLAQARAEAGKDGLSVEQREHFAAQERKYNARIKKLDEAAETERAQRGTGWMQREGKPLERSAESIRSGMLPQASRARTDAVLASNPELLEVLDTRGYPRDPTYSDSQIRERLTKAYAKLAPAALITRAKSVEAQLEALTGQRGAAARQERATLQYIEQLIDATLRKQDTESYRNDAKAALRSEIKELEQLRARMAQPQGTDTALMADRRGMSDVGALDDRIADLKSELERVGGKVKFDPKVVGEIAARLDPDRMARLEDLAGLTDADYARMEKGEPVNTAYGTFWYEGGNTGNLRAVQNESQQAREARHAEIRKQSQMNLGANAKVKNIPKKIREAIAEEVLRTRGADVKVAYERFAKLGAVGQYTKTAGKRLIEIAAELAPGRMLGVARHEALHDFFAMLKETPGERSIKSDLVAASRAPHVNTRLRELLKGHPDALEQINRDPEERVAYMYQFWTEGALQVGPRGTGLLGGVRRLFRDLFGLVTASDRGETLLQALADGDFANPNTVSEVLQDLNQKHGERIATKVDRLAPVLTKALSAVAKAAPDRLRAFNNPHLTELADAFSSERGELGIVQRKFQQQGKWDNRLAKILDDTTAAERRALIDELQSGKPPESAKAKAIAKFLGDMHDYMTDAGVMTREKKSGDWVPLRKVANYFPRKFDRHALMAAPDKFQSLLVKYGEMSKKDARNAYDALVHGNGQFELAENEHSLGYSPFAAAVKDRQFTFINASNAAEFAQFQNKDLGDTLLGYIRQAVHRAEYTRTMGNNGERAAALVKAANLTPDEQVEVGRIVQSLEGTLDPGHWSSSTKEIMAGIMTLQNVVLLPLSLVAQMMDPIVLAARTGSVKDAGTAYMAAIKRLFGQKVPGEELAEILGTVANDTVLDAMGAAYGSTHMTGTMRKINQGFFKWNGMQGWNNSMRIAATAAGEKYLLANRKDAEALAELGLTPADIKIARSRAEKGGGKITDKLDMSNPKVQEAMYRFVDQAVIRPSASNRPVWMSDPRFLLVAHLKQFTFAMHNVILRRAQQQADNGNIKPWATLMLAAPVMWAADMGKFALTGGVPTDWTFMQHAGHAIERAGLLGVYEFAGDTTKGVNYGQAPGERLLGPSFEHLMEVLRWISGSPFGDVDKVIDRTVPGARFI